MTAGKYQTIDLEDAFNDVSRFSNQQRPIPYVGTCLEYHFSREAGRRTPCSVSDFYDRMKLLAEDVFTFAEFASNLKMFPDMDEEGRAFHKKLKSHMAAQINYGRLRETPRGECMEFLVREATSFRGPDVSAWAQAMKELGLPVNTKVSDFFQQDPTNPDGPMVRIVDARMPVRQRLTIAAKR